MGGKHKGNPILAKGKEYDHSKKTKSSAAMSKSKIGFRHREKFRLKFRVLIQKIAEATNPLQMISDPSSEFPPKHLEIRFNQSVTAKSRAN